MRLIDADKLLKIENVHGGEWDGLGISKEYVYVKDIQNAPTVEERPRGEWIEERDKKGYLISRKCPLCKAYHDGMLINFCPNCGASMVKEGEAE